MKDISNYYGCKVFDQRKMQAQLPKAIYKQYLQTINEGKPLDKTCAEVIANAMKQWAIENGATHYTHWFQPMSEVTAEKHDAFIIPQDDGSVIMEFSGKELIKGEPDASSFPNGGLRDTYEARGYTAWDPTSPAFIKEDVLCVPSIFISYTGESLDKKTPLLKSQEVLGQQTRRLLALFGETDIKSVNACVGAEQEYFLIDKELYEKRKDLIYSGRTLFGAKPPKTQEMSDHYFGVLNSRVKSYMEDLNQQLWELGIPAKTQHNEVAPAQHELAPIFNVVNVSADQNQLTMEIMKKTALKHNLVCLLHEKPFAGINGSGKHNNYSIVYDGKNLFDAGDTPKDNAKFILAMTAFISACDEYQELIRISACSSGNDQRLGGHEAPPAIISLFIGDELYNFFDCLAHDKEYTETPQGLIKTAIDALPNFPKDNSDRNRTSPMAFTGNKFEFRMLGSQVSISNTNIVLNTIVAKKFDEYATKLSDSQDLYNDINQLIKTEIKAHQRILFNGNGYDDKWIEEANKRGLKNLTNTPTAMEEYLSDKNIALFEKYQIFTKNELVSRYEINLEEYSKALNIEAETMVNMCKKNIIPAAINYTNLLLQNINLQKNNGLSTSVEINIYNKINHSLQAIYQHCLELEDLLIEVKGINDSLTKAHFYGDQINNKMNELRAMCDGLEQNMPKEFWPLPSYGDLLYSVK